MQINLVAIVVDCMQFIDLNVTKSKMDYYSNEQTIKI